MAQNATEAVEAAADANSRYEFSRPAGKFETVYSIYNDFGLQSNILSIATYSNGAAAITRDDLFPALRQLISRHYALRVITVELPAEKKPHLHRTWEAQLRRIDLSRVVQFAQEDDSDGLRQVIETAHSEWFDPRASDVPLWRLKVINGRHLVFVVNHMVADGKSAYAFHSGLLEALNNPATESAADEAVVELESIDAPPSWVDSYPKSISFSQILLDLILMHAVRFFYGASMMFADAKFDADPQPWSARFDASLHRNTRVHVLRIPAELQGKVLAACKRHRVSFTALLQTVALIATATDVYPDAPIGLPNVTVSLRHYANPPQREDAMVNSASSILRVQRLGRYRDAARPPPGSSGAHISPEKAWLLAEDYTRHLRQVLAKGTACNGLVAMKLLGDEKEAMFEKAFPGLPLYSRQSLLLSNLGPFDSDSERGQWSIDDIQFSAGALRSNWGTAAPMLCVAGVRGGDCVINVTTEEGVLPDSTIEAMLEGIDARLKLLVKAEEE